MDDAGDGGGGVPEWVVTFGDMMSLLLTFFIMLVSLSEMKEEEKYQAMVDSIYQQFGHELSSMSMVPGDMRPRNSDFQRLASMGRAKRLDLMNGGDKVRAPVGDSPRVTIVRPGTKTNIGTVIYFDEEAAALTENHKETLRQYVVIMEGKPQKIEIRGHTAFRPTTHPDFRDNWDLAFRRSRETMQYLIDVLKIDSKRIRLSVAGPNEPVHLGTDQEKLKQNPRVELYLLDEVVADSLGTADELRERFREATP